MNKNQIVGGFLIAVFSGTLGFGISQLAVSAQVVKNTSDIGYVKTLVSEERTRTDARIFQLAELVRVVIDADKEKQKTLQEFIHILKVQNELLARKEKQ